MVTVTLETRSRLKLYVTIDHLRGIHVHIQFTADEETCPSRELGLRLEYVWRLLINNEGPVI